MTIHKIVFTGGPVGGKTTVMKALREKYADRVTFVAEVASILLNNGFPRPGRDVALTDDYLRILQRAILATQEAMEEAWELAARENGVGVMALDRGLMEVVAYLPGGLAAAREYFKLDPQTVYARYTRVIHLESLACHCPDSYLALRGTNQARCEDAELAIQRDHALRAAWSEHPNWTLLEARLGIAEIINRVSSVFENLFATHETH